LHLCRPSYCLHWRYVRLPSTCLSCSMRFAQRNVLWYKKAFPNGNWKLFQRPADIYMVCLTGFLLLFARLIEFSLSFRFSDSTFASNWPVSSISVGSQRDRHNRALLHCTSIVEQIGERGVGLITLVASPLLMSLGVRPLLTYSYQLLAIHTFVALCASWLKARWRLP